MREPPFWWRPRGIASVLLSPFAALYGAVAASRLSRAGARVDVPIVCVGNPTVGGAGKTPLAITIARLLASTGAHPVFLSRGYGGSLAGPVRVDPKSHSAREVGDEPRLLARSAPTIVARDRLAGAKLAIANGASVIVMDDGFQNPSLRKDVAILVIDSRRGLGNAQVLPAGPLRAPLAAQFARANALVIVGSSAKTRSIEAAARSFGTRVFRAQLVPEAAALAALEREPILAFAGIGDPEKFFATLERGGLSVAARRAFPDHHPYRPSEVAALCHLAEREKLVLVTTEKDLARLPDEGPAAELKMRSRVLPVTLAFEDEASVEAFLRERLALARQ